MKISAVSGYSDYAIHNVKLHDVLSNKDEQNPEGVSFRYLSFKGNPDKIPTQIAAAATESNYLGGIYCAGGLGDVAEALPYSIGLKAEETVGKKIDMRTFLPYYSIGDDEGRLYVLKAESAKKAAKNEPLYTLKDFKQVEADYKLKDGEQFALITKDGGAERKVNIFFLLKDIGVKGNVERMAEKTMNMETVPYRVFEVDTKGERQDRMYVIHTNEHAKGKDAYGVFRKHKRESINNNGGSSGGYGVSSKEILGTAKEKRHFLQPKTDDMFYTEFLRAYEQLTMEGKLSTPGDKYNPQNHMLHDRFCYMSLTDVVQKAQNGDTNYQGLKFSEILHNSGAGYQGKYYNPIDFFRIVATPEDFKKLQANKHYSKVKEIADKIEAGKATEKESTQIFRFFKPFFSKFMDSEGNFNMTMLAMRMTDENPKNSSIGNVSINYGKETRNLDTTDIAKGLTEEFIKIKDKTIDVVNGARPANMKTDKMGEFFGGAKLEEIMNKAYKPFKSTDTPEKIFNAKLENKKTIINTIAQATEKLSSDPDAIAKVIISDKRMKDIRKQAEKYEPNLKLTLGGLSKYENGDLLFISWGRPDPQKGYPMILEAFENFLKDESVPLEIRKHCKLLMGAGGGSDAFSGNHPEWIEIKNRMEKIANIEASGEKGYFKNNVCYVNGFFPNRLVNGADMGVFTSRFEPCGITPLECYSVGTPVISTNTGGAPDFIKVGKTGFLTKDPFMLNREKLGLASSATEDELDAARRTNIAKQIAEQLKIYTSSLKDGSWEAKQKEFIKNSLAEKIEWHNNHSYNGGRSALEIYLKDKFNVMNNDIPSKYASDMRGEFDNSAFEESIKKEKITEKISEFFRSKGGKWTIAGAAVAAIIGLGYLGYQKGYFGNKEKEEHLSCVA